MIPLIRGWTSVQRTARANIRLGATLAFVAGATNAGGFLAVGQYTSHMTGLVSAIADDLVLGQLGLALAACVALMAFVAGAASTAVLVNWGLRKRWASAYGLPLMLEALLLLLFGVFGATIQHFERALVPLTVLILCFIMGLQNAVITKISKAEIRTTHMTGLLTDMGIELGKLLYVNRARTAEGADSNATHSSLVTATPVRANRDKLRIQFTLFSNFLAGGIVGAAGFKWVGYIATLPLAIVLLLLVLRPLIEDLRRWRGRAT